MTILAQCVPTAWQGQMAVRLLAAALLGALIGLEREYHGRSAGLRTHLLVALGSAVAMAVSLAFAEAYRPAGGGVIRVDPARVAYGVMGGIGFIGAGAIIHLGAGVRGLTTAASLWCTAAIGLATGFGLYLLAAVATALVLFALVVLEALEGHVPAKAPRKITLTVPDASPDAAERYRALLAGTPAEVKVLGSAIDFTENLSRITFQVSAPGRTFPQALERLRRQAPEIARIEVE